MGNKNLSDKDLMLILKKQESILKTILDLSQLQFAENDSFGLDELIKKKDNYFEELQKLDLILEKWHLTYSRPLKILEQDCENSIQDLMGKILTSEKDFEKVIGQEKKAVSLQISHISRQMQYRETSIPRRVKIKNMKT